MKININKLWLLFIGLILFVANNLDIYAGCCGGPQRGSYWACPDFSCNWRRSDNRCNDDSECCPGQRCSSFGYCVSCGY